MLNIKSPAKAMTNTTKPVISHAESSTNGTTTRDLLKNVDHQNGQETAPSSPWSVDRWGRLIAGGTTLMFTLLGIVLHPFWLAGTLLGATNLIITSLTGNCPVNSILIYMGAREREDIFLPGGMVRSSKRD